MERRSQGRRSGRNRRRSVIVTGTDEFSRPKVSRVKVRPADADPSGCDRSQRRRRLREWRADARQTVLTIRGAAYRQAPSPFLPIRRPLGASYRTDILRSPDCFTPSRVAPPLDKAAQFPVFVNAADNAGTRLLPPMCACGHPPTPRRSASAATEGIDGARARTRDVLRVSRDQDKVSFKRRGCDQSIDVRNWIRDSKVPPSFRDSPIHANDAIPKFLHRYVRIAHLYQRGSSQFDPATT